MSHVVKQYSNAKLLLLGNGPKNYMDQLVNLSLNLGIKNNIIFTDFVPNNELPKFYNAADIGIWPGDHSITAIEAVATGLPIIVPNDDLAYKILFDNGSAIGYTRGDITSLFQNINKLISDKRCLDNISQNCLKLTSDTLSWEKVAERSIEIYSMYK
jgi:glycosyltransferase involved in cell wall biosynthesis